jgi:four helix bundle protein
MKDFKKLIVWQKGFQLFINTQKFCRKLPPEEKYELGSQLRRATFSIPANIAEGSAKATNAHKKIYLENALGSAYEAETAFLAIAELYPALKQECEIYLGICMEVQKMLIALINKFLYVK